MADATPLAVVIATYNERQTLPRLVRGIRQHVPEAQILVVDDNSPDGTGEWVREQMAACSDIRLLHREQKSGLGAATISGLRDALTRHPAWIGTMDADLSHRPQDLARMWDEAQREPGVDVVIGSRYVAGGRIENWSVRRRLASRTVNGFARRVLGLKPRDNSGAFRLYRADALRKIPLERVDNRGFAYLEQILVHLQNAGAAFREVPIVFQQRATGRSKVNPGELLRNLRDIVWLAFRR